MHLDAPLLELVGHDPGSADLLETDLGMGVQIPADRSQFVGIAVDAVDVGHGVIRWPALWRVWGIWAKMTCRLVLCECPAATASMARLRYRRASRPARRRSEVFRRSVRNRGGKDPNPFLGGGL